MNTKEFNGTYYHEETPDDLIRVLDSVRQWTGINSTVRVYYGDTITGKCWNEEHDVRGRIGRSTGTKPIPLLCHPLSYGGPALLDHCILKIVHTHTGGILYQHEKFIAPVVTIEASDMPEYSHNVLIDGELYGRCKTLRQAKLLKTKMS